MSMVLKLDGDFNYMLYTRKLLLSSLFDVSCAAQLSEHLRHERDDSMKLSATTMQLLPTNRTFPSTASDF